MLKLKLAIVSYTNTKPFLFGLEGKNSINFDIQKLNPADCAIAFKNNEVDIALLPIGALLEIGEYKMITDFCIGTEGEVNSVALLSNEKITEIDTIYLDEQSRTSAELMKLLAAKHFKLKFKYRDGLPLNYKIQSNEAMMMIGDKVFAFESAFAHKYDLGKEWLSFTGMPFVFAAWVAKPHVSDESIEMLNTILRDGVHDFFHSAEYEKLSSNTKYYLTKNISYYFDDQKIKGMSLFLKHLIS